MMPSSQKLRFFMLAAGVLLIGAALRLHGLSAMRDMLLYDEAYYAVNAISLIQEPRLTPFFPENTGRESLWMYLLAPAIAILGAVPFTLRYVAAMVAILTLAALLRLGRTILGQSGALWATLALGVLYWHVHNSHVAFRALLFPLIGMLALEALLRAYHNNQWRSWLIAGFFSGLLAYTYTAAHGWLALILGLCGLWAVFDKQRRNGTIALIIVAVSMALPVWVAIQTNPLSDGGLTRTTISTWDELIFNVQNWLQAWTGASDINPNNNTPGYPILDAPLALFASIGIFSLWFVVRKWWYSLLLLALFILSLLPSLITIRTPQYIRALGVVVPLALVIGAGAAGIEKSISAISSQLSAKKFPLKKLNTMENETPPLHEIETAAGEDYSALSTQHLALNPQHSERKPNLALFFTRGCLLILFLWSAANTWRTFDRWLAEYRLVLWIDDRINFAMAFIEDHTSPELPIYIAELDFHPVAEFHAYHFGREVRYFAFSDVGDACFVMPREPAIYLDLPIVVNQLARRMADYGTVTPLYEHPNNDYHVLQFTPPEDIRSDWQAAAIIGDNLSVQAIQPMTQTVQPGDTLTIFLGMRMQQTFTQPYTWFVHLQGIPTPYEGGTQYSAADTALCSAAYDARRTPDETLVQTLRLPIPPDLAPGDYHVAIGLYDPATNTRLPLQTPSGETRFFRVVDVTVK